MGIYIYRVATTAKIVSTRAGERVAIHPSSFAYKLHGWRENEANAKRILGPTHRAWAKRENPEAFVVLGKPAPGSDVFRIGRCYGSLDDTGEYEIAGRLVAHLGKLIFVSVAESKSVDALIRANTAFSGCDALLNAVRYRPSCDVREPAMREIADWYDAAQEARGDDRRAYRYGG